MTTRRVPLARAISKLGYASRSQAHALIRAGRVRVNGRTADDPAALVSLSGARISIDGLEAPPPGWRLIALHKPRSVVTTRSDPQGRATVYDFLRDVGTRVVPVGRLDFASTGLLLLTTDTSLADWMTDPKTGVTRRYVLSVRGKVDAADTTRLESGVADRGETLQAAVATILKASNRESHLIVELREGRNRELRRMMSAIGHEVTRLKRISFGGIELGSLAPGKWRDVGREEAASAFPGAPLPLLLLLLLLLDGVERLGGLGHVG